MELIINEDSVNKIGNYLAQRPYYEVFGLIRILESLRPLQKPIEEPKGEEEE